MRYPASEKVEIIRIVEQSYLSARRTLAQIGIPRATFYRWYDQYQTGGPEALEDRTSRPRRIWNPIPDKIRDQILEMALERRELSPRELSPRELAVTFTDEQRYFVSEASVYRLLKAHDLITSPDYQSTFIVMKAASEFKDKTTAPNQLWQPDFTYLKIIGWGWYYLSTILDDFSRYIIAWKLCTTMRAEDVTDTLELALTASGCDQAHMLHKPRLLSDNGPSYVAGELADWLKDRKMRHVRGAPFHPQTQGKAATGQGRHRARQPQGKADTGQGRHRARSNDGIRHSKTASCWRTITYPAILRNRSRRSLSTIITSVTTRASKT